jgi:anti-anti-sigma regulatory factor
MPSAPPPVIISLVEEHGSLLAGRFLGLELRQQVEEHAGNGEVVVDLAGVEMVSPSFADEFFAKLDSQLVGSGRVRLINVRPDLEEIIRTVSAGRGANQEPDQPS